MVYQVEKGKGLGDLMTPTALDYYNLNSLWNFFNGSVGLATSTVIPGDTLATGQAVGATTAAIANTAGQAATSLVAGFGNQINPFGNNPNAVSSSSWLGYVVLLGVGLIGLKVLKFV